MKWIGQNVYDFISRFRNDVYLESISSGTIASGGNLGLDSNNKIVKATAADGDITGVTAGTGLSGGGTSGTVTLNVSGLTVSEIAAGSILIAGETFADNDTSLMSAAAINDRIESFGYTTNTGDITGVDLTGSSPITINSETGTTSGNYSATIGVDAASASGRGVVELATTGEADAGTDTSRAVTPVGLRSHVNSRYSYVYMTWSASAVSSVDGSDPEWVFPNIQKGVYEEDWNKDENIKATSTGTTTYTVARGSAVNSLVIPHTGICVGFHAHGRNDDNDASFKAGLFHLEGSTTGTTNNGGIDYGSTASTHEATLRWIATADEAEASGGADGTSGHSFKGPCKLVSNTTAVNVTAGDALLPAIMGPDASDEIFVTMTIILQVPLV